MNEKSLHKGDVIVHCDDEYPDGALIVDGFNDQGNLNAHPMGGGMQLTISAADISRFGIPGQFEKTPVFRTALFSIEEVGEKFVGWTDGRHWNGWAMPFFELDTAARVVATLDPSNGRYEFATNAFITLTMNGEEERWEKATIGLPDGGFVMAYPVGAGSWIWDEEEGAAPWA